MTNKPLTSHNTDQLEAQAKHLARLKIAERCQIDLYFLTHYILGYEAMTERTHGELCQVTTSLLPSYVKRLSVSTDAQDTLYDLNKDRTDANLTPHSNPNELLDANSSYFNPPDTVPQKISTQNNPNQFGLAEPFDTNLPGLYNDTLDNQNTDGKIEESASTSATSIQSQYKLKSGELIPGNEFTLPYDPDKKALHIEMPRGTFKSSVVTIGFALQFILNDPNGRVLIDSETYSKAKNFLAEVKGHLEDNERFREVFMTLYGVYPDANKRNTSTRWTDAMLDLSCRTKQTKEASFMVSGIDKSINGMHFDLIIGDDLHSETNVTNRDQIDKVVQHYKLLLSLLDPDRYLIIIGTRWHFNDMYQYLIDYEQFRFNFYVRKARNNDGSLLFPERLHEKFLEEQRKSQGSYLFSCQYMNTPVDDEDATFKRSQLKNKHWEEIEGMPINWYLSVDPSWEGKDSDYAALVLAGLDAQSNLYVRHITRKKMTYGEIITEMFNLWQKYRPKEIVLETIASAKSISYMLSQEQQRRGVYLPVKEINGRNTNKEERIKGLQPYYEYGRAIHVSECPQREDLEDELIAFPKGKNDDIIDALATVLEVARPAKPTKDPEERQKQKERIDKYTKPRSPLTKV